MYRKRIASLAVIIALLAAIPALASEAGQYASDAGTKLSRGVLNAVTGWLEVPKQAVIGGQEDGVLGGFEGFFKGVGLGVARTLAGAFEITTFWAPVPERFEPDIFFDYGSAALRRDAREILLANAEWLRFNPHVEVTIEGHSDDRGKSEYNQVLGYRRARAVRDFLVASGIPSERISIVSYGNERPFVLGLSGALFLTGPAMAGMAMFEATALLHDHSKHTIETAILEAVEAGVRSAVAMGFSWVQVSPPLLLDDRVVVHFLATDAEAGGGDEGESSLDGQPGDDEDSGSDFPGGERF